MRYQGSKKKMIGVLKSLIEKNLTPQCAYVEPFAGGMNVVSNIDWNFKIANEINRYIYSLWTSIQDGSFNDTMWDFCKNLTKEQYYRLKADFVADKCYINPSIIGYVGSACSYGGGWWAGYANYNPKKNENHILEAYNGIQEQIKNFKHFDRNETFFLNFSYDELMKYVSTNALIYCDPPYAGTKKYANDFDSAKFWKWAEEMVMKGYKVIVSEYTAPEGWKCIWQKKMQDGMSSDSTKFKTERIFIHETEVDRIII